MEQKRIDAMTAGAPSILTEVTPDISTAKDIGIMSDVQLLLPDPKKRVKQTKQIFVDKGWSSRFEPGDIKIDPPSISIRKNQGHQECFSVESTTRIGYRRISGSFRSHAAYFHLDL